MRLLEWAMKGVVFGGYFCIDWLASPPMACMCNTPLKKGRLLSVRNMEELD